MVEIVSRIERILRQIVATSPMLILCIFSTPLLAWQGDKLAPWVGTTLYGKKCAGPGIPYGPYDYLQRARLPAELEIVEYNHFTPEVENLERGLTSSVIDDLNYTLMAWPNHHRALNSVLKYRLQRFPHWPEDSGAPPAECYLQRAIKFSPNDAKPYMMYGLLLQKSKQYTKALSVYRTANRLLPNDVITQYNLGLMLVELKKYKEARQLAEKVYSVGFPLPGLKKKLILAGHWKAEPEVAETKTPAPALTQAQLDAIKAAMLEEAARKKATPVKTAP